MDAYLCAQQQQQQQLSQSRHLVSPPNAWPALEAKPSSQACTISSNASACLHRITWPPGKAPKYWARASSPAGSICMIWMPGNAADPGAISPSSDPWKSCIAYRPMSRNVSGTSPSAVLLKALAPLSRGSAVTDAESEGPAAWQTLLWTHYDIDRYYQCISRALAQVLRHLKAWTPADVHTDECLLLRCRIGFNGRLELKKANRLG